MEIGDKLRRLRLQRGLTQEELANRCELSKSFISLLERDLTSPSLDTLADLLEALGDRDIALCRELTKLHEEVVRTTLAAAAARYAEERSRGEFVLVIRGAPEEKGPRQSLEEAMELLDSLRGRGLSLKDAAKQAAAATGQSRNDLYHAALVRDQEKK